MGASCAAILSLSAIEPAVKKRIHTFMSTSDIHLEHQFRKSRGEALELIGEMVTYARSLCDDVEFSPMDAGRSDPQFLFQVLKVAVECGATTLNIPDTVGYTAPRESADLMAFLRSLNDPKARNWKAPAPPARSSEPR